MSDMKYSSVPGSIAGVIAGGVLSGTYPNPGLVTFSVALAGDVEVAAETPVLTTPVLSAGNWLILAGMVGEQETGTTITNWSSRVNGGTATYTITGGQASSQIRAGSSSIIDQPANMTLLFTVNITVAGTIIITAFGDAGTPYIRTVTPILGYLNATGLVAIRIA